MAVISMSEVKVGVMVLFASALLIALTITVGNFQSWFSDSITISIVVTNVVGLEDYAQVTYNGVQIGKVVDKFNDNGGEKVVIKAEIDRYSPVAMDSEARFTYASLLSPIFIDITGGSDDLRVHKLLEEEKVDIEDIVIEASPYLSIGDVFSLAADVKDVLDKVEDVLDEVYDPLSKFGGFVSDVSGSIHTILSDVEGLMKDSRPQVNEFFGNANAMVASASDKINAALDNIEKSSEMLPAILQEAQGGVSSFVENASDLITSVRPEIVQTTQQFREVMSSLQESLETIEEAMVALLNNTDSFIGDNREDINRVLSRLERTMVNLERMSEELAKDPWRLIWKTDERLAPPKVSPTWRPLDTE